MIDALRTADTQLFLFFNGLHHSFFDFIMHWASNRWVWIPFYAGLLFFLWKNYRQSFVVILVITALMVTASDQLASSVIKNMVMRLRPCHNPDIIEQVHLVHGHCGGQYGFVSSHAANCFVLATFLWGLFNGKYRRLGRMLLVWALLVSYSRIYLGVHYPGDVIGGALLGAAIGFAATTVYHFYSNKKSIQPND